MSNSTIDEILESLHKLQAELEQEIDQLLTEKRQLFRYTIEQGKVRFEHSMRALQRRTKVGVWRYLAKARLGHIVTAPVIYSVLLPFILLDLLVTIYQHICFRVYGIPRVVRSNYLVIDRQQLAYLNVIEKMNCVYCGYANGVVEYVREVSARTEQYWCPIKHARRTPDPHRLVKNFVDYGDADSYKKKLKKLQKKIASLENKNHKNSPNNEFRS